MTVMRLTIARLTDVFTVARLTDVMTVVRLTGVNLTDGMTRLGLLLLDSPFRTLLEY